LSGLFYAVLYATVVHSAMHTHMKKSDSSVGYIKFGKTIPKDWSGKGSISKM